MPDPTLHVINVAAHLQDHVDVPTFCDPSHEHTWEWQARCTGCGVEGRLTTKPEEADHA